MDSCYTKKILYGCNLFFLLTVFHYFIFYFLNFLIIFYQLRLLHENLSVGCPKIALEVYFSFLSL